MLEVHSIGAIRGVPGVCVHAAYVACATFEMTPREGRMNLKLFVALLLAAATSVATAADKPQPARSEANAARQQAYGRCAVETYLELKDKLPGKTGKQPARKVAQAALLLCHREGVAWAEVALKEEGVDSQGSGCSSRSRKAGGRLRAQRRRRAIRPSRTARAPSGAQGGP
jgi:hypothetical protein